MPGHHYTAAWYKLQKVVEGFGNLLCELAERSLTHTYVVVFGFYQIENIDYLVLRYLNTSALPIEELFEEWLYNEEI